MYNLIIRIFDTAEKPLETATTILVKSLHDHVNKTRC